MKRKLAVSFIALLISIILASLITARPTGPFMNTIYTVAGIMFSIGMGIICTFNPDRVKDRTYFLRIRNNINSVRNSFIFFFSLISIGFLAYQIFPSAEARFALMGYSLSISASLFVAILIVLSITYFIINFLS